MTEIENQKDKTQIWRVSGDTERHSVDEVYSRIKDFVSVKGFDYDIGIGTDSQMVGQSFQFISVISVHRIGKGGLYFYQKFFEPRAKFPVGVQKMRMFHEVARSVELGLHMLDKTGISPVIHIDASPPAKTKEFTSKFSEQLRGYAQGCGFTCMLKPESYIAHAIADRHTKKRSRKRRARARRA